MDEDRPNQPDEQQPPASEPTITAVSATEEPSRRLSGMAIVSLVLAFLFALAAIFFPVFSRAREAGKTSICFNNIKQISMAITLYMEDNDGWYPNAENWNDLLKPYIKDADVFMCPAERSKAGTPTYGMNARLSGLRKGGVHSPRYVVMFFDSIPGRDRAGGPELLPQPPRHGDRHVFSFADGSARAFSDSQVPTLNWDPSFVRPPETIPPPVEP